MTMRVLVVTKIFPNRDKPDGATYNRHQLRELNRVADVEVMAVIPWLPGREQLGGPPVPDVPEHDVIDGLPVTHPKALYGPAFARPLSGMLYTASLIPHLVSRRDDFDVVMGCFGYPDGWTAVTLGRLLGLPSVIKVHNKSLFDNRGLFNNRGPFDNRALFDDVAKAHQILTTSHVHQTLHEAFLNIKGLFENRVLPPLRFCFRLNLRLISYFRVSYLQ